MAFAPQEPSPLNVSFVRGDAWALEIDFAESIVGKTWTAGLYSLVTGQLVQLVTAAPIDEAAGRLNLSLTATQTAGIPHGSYDFRVAWGPTARRTHEGVCEVLP
jgi:hypothetical protein